MRTHGFRKFYANQCSRAHIDYPTREYLIGHRLPGQEPSCNRMTEEDRLSEYVKAIPLLTIDPNQRLHTKINELETGQKQEIARLKAHLEAREEKNHKISEEWQKLKEEMNELRKFVFPGPVPRDKQMRKTYLKFVKSHYQKKGMDVDVMLNDVEKTF